jgi:hypothetical protein
MAKLTMTDIREDGGTQSRTTLFIDTAEEYANAMVDGEVFPPVIVFYDGEEYWLADGFHRKMACEFLDMTEMEANVRQGTRRDAILYSVSANAAHGIRRTNDDKRAAVKMLLDDEEWAQWSDREIGRRCGVDGKFVGRLRPAPSAVKPQIGRKVKRGGTTYRQEPKKKGAPSSTPAPPEMPKRRDMSHDYFTHELKDIIKAVEKLPAPEYVVEHFPQALQHAVAVERINKARDWLAAFAPLWEKDHPRRQAIFDEKYGE